MNRALALAGIVLVLLGGSGTALAQTLSVEAVVARMNLQTIQNATIITHGYQISDSGGDSLRPLAVDIYNAIPGTGWLLDYDIVGGDNGAAMFDGNSSSGSINLPAAGVSGQVGHLVLLFDWAPESNETSSGWTEAAGDALFALLVALGVADPQSGTGVPLHFIGHSFGCAVNSECVERLARYGVAVDQVTYLDPHDFDQPVVPVDCAQAQFTLGAPSGYGASVWENVLFADTYYQTRGHNGSFFPDNLVPVGRPISGAYNRFLSAPPDLPPLNSYSIFDASGDHTYVWNCFYRGTVLGSLPAGCPAASGPLPAGYYTSTGWRFSPFAPANQQVPQPPPVFYGANQSHIYSNPALVDAASGNPNASGLASLGLTADEVTAGGWPPQWNPMFVANHDFQGGFDGAQVPGWSEHGGGGGGDLVVESGGNQYLRLSAGNVNRVHNRAYIPFDALNFEFGLWRTDPSADDLLNVRIGGTLLGAFSLTATDVYFTTQSLGIPAEVRDTVQTITFELVSGDGVIDSVVGIDAVHFDLAVPVQIVSANPPLSAANPYEPGQPYTDALDTGTGSSVTAGIGAAGTPSQGSIQYSPITVTFSGVPVPAPSPANIVVACIGPGAPDCPTVTAVAAGGTPNEFLISLSSAIPPLQCTTLTFAGTAPGARVQYRSQPGNVNLDPATNTQDLLSLVQALNNGSANQALNLARYNVDRMGMVNTQDLLRLVQLLNGVSTTQVFNGTTADACPP